MVWIGICTIRYDNIKNKKNYLKKMNSVILPITFFVIFSLTFSIAQVSAISLMVNGYDMEYDIEGGSMSSITLDSDFSSLIVDIEATSDGQIQISIPRSLLDAKLGANDDIFFILVDDHEIDFDEPSTDNSTRTLLIPFSKGSAVIEIIGTDVGPKKVIQDTIEESSVVEQVMEKPEIKPQADSSGGCLIATATFGSELAPQVQQLRELRDNKLLQTKSGIGFMNTFNNFYYSFSPYIADYERENSVFKEMVKIIITPMISSLSILNYVDIDSESKVLGYGISLILLNVGMYFAIPAIIIMRIRK